MTHFLSVSEVARRLGVPPRDISDLFYQRELRDDLCPIIAGRRLIPESYVEQIELALGQRQRRVASASRSSARGGCPASTAEAIRALP